LTESRKLYNILGNVLSSLYSQNLPQVKIPQFFDVLSMIARQCQDLEDWLESLPTPLRDDVLAFSNRAASATDVSGNMIKVLRLRYYNIRNLIHRPILGLALSALDKSPESISANSPNSNQFANFCQPSLEVSVESAAAIISIANSFEFDKIGPGMWWTLLYIGKVHSPPLVPFCCSCSISIQRRSDMLWHHLYSKPKQSHTTVPFQFNATRVYQSCYSGSSKACARPSGG